MLTSLKEISARFSEVDSMGIVWHGHYLKYFEDGREAFGREYGLGYMDVYEKGFLIPIVNISCSFKKPIPYNQALIVETKFVDSPAAKILFTYRILDPQSETIYATGNSEQVFITHDRELHLTIPDFFREWKKHKGIV